MGPVGTTGLKKTGVQPIQNTVNVIAGLIFVYFLYSYIVKTPSIGGPDFFYYILTGRDLSDGFEVGSMRYGYFPGVYWLWKYCFDVFGHSLIAIQTIYVGVLLGSALLSAGCVYLLTRKIYAAFFAGSLYIILLHILEGWGGVIEPVATFFMLIGFLTYLHFYRKKMYQASAVCIVIFFGLCLFMKQQGIFFVAASAFLPFAELKRFFQINKSAFLVPFATGVLVFILIVIEGGGIEAIRISMSMATSYTHSGSAYDNLAGYFKSIEPVFNPILAFLLPMAVFIFLINRKRLNKDIYSLRVLLFLVLSAVLPLYQFRVREYLHYGIYTIPALTLLTGWAIGYWVNQLSMLSTAKKIGLACASMVLLGFGFKQSYAGILRVQDQVLWLPPQPLQADTAKLADVCPHIQGPTVLLLPPRVNTLHWICNTRTALDKWAYSWYEEAAPYYFDLISRQNTNDVFVFDKSFGDYEDRILSRADWTGLEEQLQKNSYSVAYVSAAGRLYHKK